MSVDIEADPMHETPPLGAKVRALRRQRGWTQQELGDRMGGVPKHSVSRIENRLDGEPTELMMQRLGKAFELDPDELRNLQIDIDARGRELLDMSRQRTHIRQRHDFTYTLNGASVAAVRKLVKAGYLTNVSEAVDIGLVMFLEIAKKVGAEGYQPTPASIQKLAAKFGSEADLRAPAGLAEGPRQREKTGNRSAYTFYTSEASVTAVRKLVDAGFPTNVSEAVDIGLVLVLEASKKAGFEAAIRRYRREASR